MVKDKEVLEEKIKKINEEFGFFKNQVYKEKGMLENNFLKEK